MKTIFSKKKTVFAVVGVLVILGIAVFLFAGGNKEFNEHMKLAMNYLDEMNYEEAIVEFTEAFNLEPKNRDAIEGIETACLAYAESVLSDTEEVEIETFVKVSNILMSSYELTQIESIQLKAAEIDKVVEEKETAIEEARLAEEKAKKEAEEKAIKEAEEKAKKEAEEKAKKEAEEAKRLEEEKKKAEEEARKQKVSDFYKKKAKSIALQDYYMDVNNTNIEENEDEWIITVKGFVCAWNEKLVFHINKQSEKAIITEHWMEDYSSGEWMALAAGDGYSAIGTEYNFTYTE